MESEWLTLDQAGKELSFCNSYSRLPTLLEISTSMDEVEWLHLLGHSWPSCDNIGRYIDELWDSPFGWRQGLIPEMMTPEDRAAYEVLPDVVTIYRGCYTNNKWGLSWSLSKELAERFPMLERYRQEGQQPLLVTAEAKKEDIIAVKVDRGESEIIAWRPKHISTRHLKTRVPS